MAMSWKLSVLVQDRHYWCSFVQCGPSGVCVLLSLHVGEMLAVSKA